ncbi:MAG: leucyl/phenylalanyl-tRNA--protein transferase [Bacteroidetes bacterium]|nr:leucyl/phenylalanyl-tRNA--protein transferase [Bacteroidota bacterium]MBS1940181.1 leucyl/phenylalanyl-tRNA--protein transferase [Bacteroidota bacterium]
MLCTDSAPVLSTQLLLAAYRKGFFPMTDETGQVQWHCPDPRAIFPLGSLTPNTRLRRFLRGSGYAATMDTAFETVMEQCATVHGRSWISPAMVAAYTGLHRAGHAHSVETWLNGQLIGGIYGVAIGAAFFGESMFSLKPNASKAAFYFLVEHLRQQGFLLFDTQYINHHTESLGAIEISRKNFLRTLRDAVPATASF